MGVPYSPLAREVSKKAYGVYDRLASGLVSQPMRLPAPGTPSVQQQLVRGGNALAIASGATGAYSVAVTGGGLLTMMGGAVTAQPHVSALGVAAVGLGGLTGVGAGVLQFGSGLLHGAGGAGFDNAINAAGTLLTGAAISRLVTGGGAATGYRTVSQRADDRFFQNTNTVTGGVYDVLTSTLEQLGPKQVPIPPNGN